METEKEKTDPMTLAVARFIARVAYRLNRESIEACRQECQGDYYGMNKEQPDDHSIGIARELLAGWDVAREYEREVVKRTGDAQSKIDEDKQKVRNALEYLDKARTNLNHLNAGWVGLDELNKKFGVRSY